MTEKLEIFARIGLSVARLQGLEDHLLSALLRQERFEEDGFTVVAVDERRIVFAVPRQDLRKWYVEEKSGEMQFTSKKRAIAEELSTLLGLEYFSPPDDASARYETSRVRKVHRHFTFQHKGTTSLHSEPLAIVHAGYLQSIWYDISSRIDPEKLFQKLKEFYL